MDFDDERFDETPELGSDELLSDDSLNLPDSASMLVRVHALRSWLTRRQKDAAFEIGRTALNVQELMQAEAGETHLRRREREAQAERLQRSQQAFQDAQQRLSAYEEAEALLEECIVHTTTAERVLVEYYLTLEELVQNGSMEHAAGSTARLAALADVQHRIERVGTLTED